MTRRCYLYHTRPSRKGECKGWTVDILHFISDSFRFSPRNSMFFADGIAVILVVTRLDTNKITSKTMLQTF